MKKLNKFDFGVAMNLTYYLMLTDYYWDCLIDNNIHTNTVGGPVWK